MELTPEQIESYHRDGFLIVPGVFANEVDHLQTEASRLLGLTHLMDSNNIRCRWQNHADTDECRFDCFDPVIDLSPACHQVAHDSRLLALMSQLYGEAAFLFKDKLIFKPPGAKGYDLHQDFIAFPGFPESFTTAIVALDSSDAASGATEVFPGLHLQGCLTPRDGDYHPLDESLIDDSQGVLLELQPGDIAFFSGFTPHRSGPNRSNHSRRLLYLSFNAARDGGDLRSSHYTFFHQWLQEKYAQFGRTDTYFR